jgi:hypothetical protein
VDPVGDQAAVKFAALTRGWCNTPVDDLVVWIQGLFDDCSFNAPFGIGWDLDRAEPPVIATVTPADCSTARIVLGRDDVLRRINFASCLQAFLDVELDRPVPPCPVHVVGLVPVRLRDAVHWRCPAGDFQCRVGDYQDALWPPGLDDYAHRIGPMLARRFSRRRLDGIHSFGIEVRDQQWVVKIKLRPDADELAIRATADPILVEAEQVEGLRTIRAHRSATETEPAHRALTLAGAVIQLAALRGRLRRAGAADACDFLVANTPVRLLPEHELGPPGRPVVLDRSGAPFADEDDTVCCVGGFAPTGPVRGQTPVFDAGELRVYE